MLDYGFVRSNPKMDVTKQHFIRQKCLFLPCFFHMALIVALNLQKKEFFKKIDIDNRTLLNRIVYITQHEQVILCIP